MASNKSHFRVEVMEIKTVSTRPCWENHLHRLALHLHGHRHGHLHQVPLTIFIAIYVYAQKQATF